MQHNNFQPQSGFIPLNELDKLFFSWGDLGYHAVSRILFEFKGGSIDLELLRQAYAVEIKRRPVLNARIDDSVPGNNWKVYWKLRTDSDAVAAVRMCDLSALSFRDAEVKVRQLQFDPFGGYNLRTDPPFFIHLCRMPASAWKLLVFIHHALADGHGITLILEELIAAYNRLAAGDGIDIPPGEIMTARQLPLLPANRLVLVRQILCALFYFVRLNITARLSSAAKIAYGSHRFRAATAAVCRSVSPERLARYRAAAKRVGVTFNVLLVGAQALALERWKRSRGENCGLINIQIHQNLRSSPEDFQQLSNKFCPFIIPIPSAARKDPKKLLQYVQRRQEQAVRNQTAQKIAALLSLLNTSLGRKTQKFWQHLIFNNPRFGDSSTVSNIGKLWVGSDGLTHVTRLGDAEIKSVYIAGPPVPSIGSYFGYLTYNDTLFIMFNYFEWTMTDDDARCFVDLFEEILEELAGYC